MAKKTRIIIRLVVDQNELTDAEKRLKGVNGFYRTTYKNPRMEGGHNGKIRLKMFHPVLNRHAWFIEKKIK